MRRNLKYLPKQYEILSYQPIHVFEKNNSGSSNQQQQQQEQPNFGLWDCRHTINNQTNSSSTTSILLQSPLQSCYVSSSSTSKPTFLITIDLDTDNLDKVQPTLTSMIHSIIHSIALMKQKETNTNQNDDDDTKKNGHVGSIDDVTLNNLINSIPKFGACFDFCVGGI